PDRAPSATRLGITYGALNLVGPLLGGLPVCHGAGGLAGHHAFGARTGGSVVIYGALYLVIGLCFAGGFTEVVKAFPLPVLGVLLAFEAVALMRRGGGPPRARHRAAGGPARRERAVRLPGGAPGRHGALVPLAACHRPRVGSPPH